MLTQKLITESIIKMLLACPAEKIYINDNLVIFLVAYQNAAAATDDYDETFILNEWLCVLYHCVVEIATIKVWEK